MHRFLFALDPEAAHGLAFGPAALAASRAGAGTAPGEVEEADLARAGSPPVRHPQPAAGP